LKKDIRKRKMGTIEFKTLCTKKLENQNTNELARELKKLMNNTSKGVDLIIESILDILESRLDEKEFVELCNTL